MTPLATTIWQHVAAVFMTLVLLSFDPSPARPGLASAAPMEHVVDYLRFYDSALNPDQRS